VTGIEPGQERASGDTTASEIADEVAAELEEPHSEQLDVERMRLFEFVGFQRMRTEWSPEDGLMVQRYQRVVNETMLAHFADAYAVMNDIYDIVREPLVGDGGEFVLDSYGFVQWRRTPTGAFIEDWSRLGLRQREDFLFRITTAIFAWQQRAADLWGESMFSKAKWIEHFAVAFDSVEGKATVDARTARGNIEAAEDRYFAIFLSLLSRKADALVRSMELISQRLKDVIVSNG
jgi:hypothetical protein